MTGLTASTQALGIIAGNRTLPLVLADQARSAGVTNLVAVGFENETDPALAGHVDELIWLKVGQLSKLIGTFTSRGVRRCVMVGQIAPKNLYDVRPDLRAMAMLFKLRQKNAHTIFGALAGELQKDGVELLDPRPWLKAVMPSLGFRLGPQPDETENEDVAYGFEIAKEISRLEIGQTVVVKDGTILAVEGFEGTDNCLTRGGQLAGKKGGAVAVKVAKENHDFRFDIPCIGAQTLQICHDSGIRVLAFEANKTLLLDREAVEQTAVKNRITVMTVL